MRKTTLTIFFCTILFLGQGQIRLSLPFTSAYDEDATVLLGIQYNYVNQNYQLALKKDWQSYAIDYPGDNINDINGLKSIHSYNSHGFSVGIPMDIRTNANLYLTFNPSFLFINNSGIVYTGTDPLSTDFAPKSLIRRTRHLETSTNGTNFNAFEFPLSIKYRSDEKIFKNKFNRYRGYVAGGLRYTRFIGIAGEYEGLLKERQNTPIPQSLIWKIDYPSWEVGLGVDIFFPYFKMSPEIKFNQSFGSVLDHEHPLAAGNKFMAPIEKGLIRNIYVSLIFQ
ncbi:MAG TPA: PorT [Sphingobacterium sp.]|nr:PorT [Sphingobacterium sp.]